jgi:hypothetical protein
MELQELSKEQLIDMIHRQADEIAAREMEIECMRNQQQLKTFSEKEALKLQPVEVDGELWYFRLPRWHMKGRTYTAEEVMMNEPLLRSILAKPGQMILKKQI